MVETGGKEVLEDKVVLEELEEMEEEEEMDIATVSCLVGTQEMLEMEEEEEMVDEVGMEEEAELVVMEASQDQVEH